MKTCTKCKTPKPLKQFHRKGAGHKSQCKECVSRYYKAAYRDKPQRRQQVRNAVRKRVQDLKQFVDTLKNKPCADCNKKYPAYVMDFDHQGNKVKTIAQARLHGWSKVKILEEISKCELVCANCHRERTFGPVRSTVGHSSDK